MQLKDLNRFSEDDLDLVPVEFLEAAIEVFNNGAKKYGRHSWEQGKHYSHMSNCDSVFHHLSDARNGRMRDIESGLDPFAHGGVRMLMGYTLRKRAGIYLSEEREDE